MIRFENVENKYVNQAVEIAKKCYEKERQQCKGLIEDDFEGAFREVITGLFGNGKGKVAIEDEKVIGYMAFWGPFEGFHGNVKGMFSPLGGSGFNGNDNGKLASLLVQAVCEEFVKDGILQYAISYYAHDEEVKESMMLNSFGIRCSDLVMKLSERSIDVPKQSEVEYMEIPKSEVDQVAELRKQMVEHMVSSPCFFPTCLKHYDEKFKEHDYRLFVAKAQGKIVGFMILEDGDSETFVSAHNKIRNLGTTFVSKEYRNHDIANGLLEHVCKAVQNEGYIYLGVDCETVNPTALRFWRKQFMPYTYTYIRRIDERACGYDEYMKEYYKNN